MKSKNYVMIPIFLLSVILTNIVNCWADEFLYLWDEFDSQTIKNYYPAGVPDDLVAFDRILDLEINILNKKSFPSYNYNGIPRPAIFASDWTIGIVYTWGENMYDAYNVKFFSEDESHKIKHIRSLGFELSNNGEMFIGDSKDNRVYKYQLNTDGTLSYVWRTRLNIFSPLN